MSEEAPQARVHLTRRALTDIDEIHGYSVERWGGEVAERYLDDVDSALRRLAQFPSLLQERPDDSLRLGFYPVGHHVLLCDVIGGEIYVLALRHASMDLPRRLVELEPQLVYEAQLLRDRIARDREDLDAGL
jgi:toxin ParE1/3/4